MVNVYKKEKNLLLTSESLVIHGFTQCVMGKVSKFLCDIDNLQEKDAVLKCDLQTKRGEVLGVKYLMLLGLLSYAAYTDMVRTKVSNRLIVSGLLIALVFRIFGEGWTGILIYLINISIPVILLYLLFQLRALGAGDIKLFSMIGAFIKTEQLVQVIVWAFIAGAFAGVLKLVNKYLLLRIWDGKLTQIHFSPAILIAYVFNIWRWTHG